jgi:hypothetical protein
MSAAASLSGASLISVQQQFEAALPTMDRVLLHHARAWPARIRDDMIADARAALWSAWHSLVRRGRNPFQVGITGIAARCCRSVRSGRKVGNANRGRACLDVLDHRARRRMGIEIVNLDDHAGSEPAAGSSSWRQWLTERNVATPADQACFRLDFARWLSDIPHRKRQMAELLADGNETSEVAHRLGVTAPAVSIARGWLSSDWRRFQGETMPGDCAPARRLGGRPAGPRGVSSRGSRRQPLAAVSS